MITIKSPRYHDRTLLIARYKIPCGHGVTVKILNGSYKGIYNVSSEVLCSSPIESMKTRYGRQISMRAVPLDKLERVEE